MGPTRDRHITDSLCIFIILAFWAFNIYIIIYAFKNGNPKELISTMDYNGNICGKSGAAT